MALVIACLNVATLQLARTASSHNELGVLAGAIAMLFSWAVTVWLAKKFAEALPPEARTALA